MIRLGSAITEGGAGLVDGSKGVVAENAVYVWESAIVVEAGLEDAVFFLWVGRCDALSSHDEV